MNRLSLTLQQFLQFAKEAKQEAKKVNWPTGKETAMGTMLVLVFSVFVALLLGLFDVILARIIERFIIS